MQLCNRARHFKMPHLLLRIGSSFDDARQLCVRLDTLRGHVRRVLGGLGVWGGLVNYDSLYKRFAGLCYLWSVDEEEHAVIV